MKWYKILVTNIMALSKQLKSEKAKLSGKQALDADKLNKIDLLKVKTRNI